MAFVPDTAIENFYLLTPAEIKLFCLYCRRRNKQSGGWKISDELAAKETHLSRNRVSEARVGLEKKGWIKKQSNNFIKVLFGFELVENPTNSVENSTKKVENPTNSVENSTKIDSHIRNNQLSYQHSQDSNESFEGENARPRTEIPIDEIFEISEPQLDEISTTAIRIYRDVFPTTCLDGQVLTEFAARLPEVEENIWRQTLLDWRLARYKATNIPGMISRYKKDLAESKKEQENGANQRNKLHKQTAGELIANRSYRRKNAG